MNAMITTLVLMLSGGMAAEAQVTPYPRVPGDPVNRDYPAVHVNGAKVETAGTIMKVGYAHFAFSGEATVIVTAREEIESFDLSPHSYGIKAVAEGRKLSFTLDRPRKLHLKVNGLQRFFIFADAPETNAPRPGTEGVATLSDYGVSPSLDDVQTAAIQAAIDDSASKGKTLYVGPGMYLTGGLHAKSGLSLYLAPGSIVKGTGRVEDFPTDGKFVGGQLLYVRDAKDVRVSGRGVLDADGRAMRMATRGASPGKVKLVRTFRAANVLLQDILVRDPGSWGIHVVETDSIRIAGVKLISLAKREDPKFPFSFNTDGIDIDNSSHVLVEECFISCHDDALCVKLQYGSSRNVEGMVFRRNVLWTGKSALKIGDEVREGCRVTGVTFEDNDVIHADRGITIRNYWGGEIHDARWVGNRFEYIGGDSKERHFEIKIQDGGGKGIVRGVLIKDNTFEQFSPQESQLKGLDAEHSIQGITFENLVVSGRTMTSLSGARIRKNAHVLEVEFK